MNFIKSFWDREPVVFVTSGFGIFDAVLVLLGVLGVLHFDSGVIVAIGTVEGAIATFIQRSQVTPVAAPNLPGVVLPGPGV